jgi:hypothetical protein
MTHRARLIQITLLVLASFLGSLLTSTPAWSQGLPGAAPATPPGGPTVTPPESATGTWGGTLFVVGAAIALVLIIGVIAKMYDLRQRWEAEAISLQSRLSDALLTDRNLEGLAVTPTAHVPLWTGSPVTIEVSGEVSSPELKERVLRVVERETRYVRSDVEVEDKLLIRPPIAARRAA